MENSNNNWLVELKENLNNKYSRHIKHLHSITCNVNGVVNTTPKLAIEEYDSRSDNVKDSDVLIEEIISMDLL